MNNWQLVADPYSIKTGTISQHFPFLWFIWWDSFRNWCNYCCLQTTAVSNKMTIQSISLF